MKLQADRFQNHDSLHSTNDEDGQLFENLVDKNRLTERLGMPLSSINKLMTQELPYFKIGRSVRFRLSDVQTWLQKRRMS